MGVTDPLTEHFERERRGLLAHSYRMLGTWDEAEDAVQEAYLRAFQAWPGFQERSSTRTWLFRIVTNVCLTALRGRGRRALPAGLAADGSAAWIQPVPTSLVDPETAAVAREGVRLAFVAGLRHLPARQRAVLLLREVLAFPAAEVALTLGMSVAAVKSALQRARARLAEVAPSPEQVTEPPDGRTRELLARYMAAWEHADPVALERVLRTDAVLDLVPSGDHARGRAACLALAAPSMDGGWRMAPTGANGQPAALAWWHGEPFGVAVLTPAAGGVAAVTVFADPALVARFSAADVPAAGA
ncbi:RNA polymerase subunit sigma-70 [Dactylosporangium aurantiacum]|uniref:RNA polymerase subunit sigma-70 n=1 Tax=Dactylosporangium aurantiacum TaxID=35754 RepID=A0A9Q9ILD3_9ACTN|nr:RNA polymerase subunit sigma-70 [Dactylosporangium aurantiacum]MDG6103286.1 RNA polymerase subunit sigma-70 [Dactylosporangium aurantiacum]UWZ57786.1 RNA polymerase subunit sigma-70 [Dactylosporangium aurantiacum]